MFRWPSVLIEIPEKSSLFVCYDYRNDTLVKLATKKSVLDPAKTTRMHHTISSPKSFCSWRCMGAVPTKSVLRTYLPTLLLRAPLAYAWESWQLLLFSIFSYLWLKPFLKHRNYSLFYSLHIQTLQSIHGISQIFQRDFLWASKGMT